MPPTMGCSTEAGQGGPIVKALAVANAAVRKPPDVWRKICALSICAISTTGGPQEDTQGRHYTRKSASFAL